MEALRVCSDVGRPKLTNAVCTCPHGEKHKCVCVGESQVCRGLNAIQYYSQ